MDSRFLINLNQPPPLINYDNEEGEVPISVTSSSSGNFIVEPNEDSHGIIYPIIELDVHELREDNDRASSDSSDDEIVAEQIGDTYAMTTTIVETQQTGQGNVRERKRRVLADAERWAVYRTLLEKSVNGKLKKNTTKEVQDMYNIKSVRTVQRIWKIHKTTPPCIDVDVSSRKTKNCGRKRVEIDLTRVQEIGLNQRTTLTSLSDALGVSYTTLYRLFKHGFLCRHSSSIKPHLKEENKISRLRFCLLMLEENTMLDDYKFKGMYDYVYIDDKWFYMTKKDQRYYLLDNEDDPNQSCQSKNFIGKVMFLAATARPRFDDDGREIFDGKIGCWPFVIELPAQRSSRNRNAGTMEMKAIASVKRETIKAFLIEKVIPAIQEKWPKTKHRETIFIQQDNARTHVPPTDPDFIASTSQCGLDIRLTCQPPNSPDFNILDLGFLGPYSRCNRKSVREKFRSLSLP